MSETTVAALIRAFAHGEAYARSIERRRVFPDLALDRLRGSVDEPLPETPSDAAAVVDEIARRFADATVATAGPRYFGFVTGGALPAAMAADCLATMWDQNAALYVMSPAAAVAEEIAARWLLDVLQLPSTASVGFVTGCHMANVTALAAARHELLRRVGWDVEANGLFGAPPIRVIVGAEAHASVTGALRLLGLGASRVTVAAADDQGRMQPAALEAALDSGTAPTIICAQAGNVNTGAIDPLAPIAALARNRGAWLHVDGAFGLWARASPALAPLAAGAELADSWATDAHKWLNVPYDSGIVAVAHPAAHRAALSVTAAYLVRSPEEPREPMDFAPEASRRARGFGVYAALRSLGRQGVAALVERCCALARLFAARLGEEPALTILNEVVLNQVLVRVAAPSIAASAGAASVGAASAAGSQNSRFDRLTQEMIARVQRDGVCWVGGTRWREMEAMRISLSNWSTTEDDVRRSADSIIAAARAVRADAASHIT
jgi:glutamate/tyrosine decarboxylase-like PLP-dependent enzyme